MTYVYLMLAIVFEVGWAIGLKVSGGPARPWLFSATAAMYVLSLVFLMLAARRLEIGAVYAMWAGAGVALIAIIGFAFLGESASPLKAVSLAFVIAGVVGLNLAGVHSKAPPHLRAPDFQSQPFPAPNTTPPAP